MESSTLFDTNFITEPSSTSSKVNEDKKEKSFLRDLASFLIVDAFIFGGYIYFEDLINSWLLGGNEIEPGITVHGFAYAGLQEDIADGIEVYNQHNGDCADFGPNNPIDIYVKNNQVSNVLGYVVGNQNAMNINSITHDPFGEYINDVSGNISVDLNQYVTTHEAFHLCQDLSGDTVRYANPINVRENVEVVGSKGGVTLMRDENGEHQNYTILELAADLNTSHLYYSEDEILNGQTPTGYRNLAPDFFTSLKYTFENLSDRLTLEETADILLQATKEADSFNKASDLLADKLWSVDIGVNKAEFQDFMDKFLGNFVYNNEGLIR